MKPEEMSDEKLVSLRAAVEAEMRARGLKFSVGDIGESLAIEFFNETPGLPGLQDAPVGTKNVDAISRDGERYSIKTVQRGSKTGTVYPDSSDSEKQLFEYMLVVRLDKEYQLLALYRLDWLKFKELRAWDKRMNAWYLPVNNTRLREAECLYGENSG